LAHATTVEPHTKNRKHSDEDKTCGVTDADGGLAGAGLAFRAAALMLGLGLGRLLRLRAGDRITVGMAFAAGSVALATAIAVTVLNRIELAVFTAVHFLVEVPLPLGAVGWHRAGFQAVRA
jgi:ACR3 family arsenite efflux pump ArsB